MPLAVVGEQYLSYDNCCNITYMDSESQDAITQIEAALGAMRREHLHGRRGPDARREGGRGMGRPPWVDGTPPSGGGAPPWGEGTPPWGDGPAWGRGGPGRARGGPLGGAARLRLLDALRVAGASATRMGISEIAEAIGVDQPRASRLVNDAMERGLVTRRADERDARRSVVELTDAGRDALESTRATRRSAVAEAVAAFTPEETATFANLLTRFVAGLKH